MRGYFIVIDGIDGTGKTLQVKMLGDLLTSLRVPFYLTREPTADPEPSEIGQLLRKFLRDPSSDPAADALLFVADRVNHCRRVIEPKLKEGVTVVSDRYVESTIAYQLAQSREGKFAGYEPGRFAQWLSALNEYVPRPDITIILDCDPEVALSRLGARPEHEKFERKEFLKEVRDVFLSRAEECNNYNYCVLDASRGADVVKRDIAGVVRALVERDRELYYGGF